jgi:hypothetical protein
MGILITLSILGIVFASMKLKNGHILDWLTKIS